MNVDLRIKERLEAELEQLKIKTNMGKPLQLLWLPNNNSKLSGEVKDDIIRIYEAGQEDALHTLRHEFYDWLVAKAIEPYAKISRFYAAMVNGALKKLEDEAYQNKEEIVEALACMF